MLITSNRNWAQMQFVCSRLRLTFVCVLLSCVALTGCIVAPVPMMKRIEVPGSRLEKKPPDLTFVHAGTTGREEVSQKLAAIDTGYASEDMFFGRWVSSGSGWIWLIAGGYSAEGGYWRNWRVHNIFVTFDNNGIVKDVGKVDDKDLLATATGLPRTHSYAGDASIAVDLCIHHEFRAPTALVLKTDAVVFNHPDPPKIYFQVAPQEVSRLRLIRRHHPDPASLEIRMDFRRKTALGRRVLFTTAPSDLLRLTEYLRTANPGALR